MTRFRTTAAVVSVTALLIGAGAAIALAPNDKREDHTTRMTPTEATSTRALAIDRTPPVIEYQSAAEPVVYTGDCGPTAAPVRASVPKAASVRLTWTEPAGALNSIDMIWGPDEWTASLGPFADPGAVTWNVEAIDAEGNRAAGHERTLEVAACAG